jgi:hypothetical protein
MSTEVTKRALSVGLGLGAVALLAAPRAKADVPFSSYAFQAEGTPTPRTLPKRLAEIKNVKDFGAVGNGSTDDTAAIQAAVNYSGGPYSVANRGTIFFPSGVYRVSAPITFELNDGVLNIRFLGAPGAMLVGSFGDALLKRSWVTPVATVISIENLQLQNNHATGKGIILNSCVGGRIVNCAIMGCWRGIETWGSQSVSVDGCSIIGQQTSGSVGIVAGNATTIIATDVTAFENGIRHQNLGLIVHGGRFEVNGVGIRLGVNHDGDPHQSSAFSLSGMSMERNQTAIQVVQGVAGTISFSCGSGEPVAYGLHIISASDLLVTGTSIGGAQGFSQAGIAVDAAWRLCMLGVYSQSWRINAAIDTSGFLQTNKP